ncbi:MAG TPA: DUF87 domain-containing protein [Candidatus Angelobacter sp.]|nr:DUF87 domain-containing protein [Candidatus Angelobacter sp.]
MKLCFPEKVLLQHLIALGKTGAGKSSALRHIVEHLLRHKKRVCIVDIKGDWWGLKSSADGKSAGFPVVAFGDFREPKAQDVPINAQSGKQVAELIASGNRPCIIGFRGWMPSQVTDFWIDFASTLFNKNEGELFVVISECHNYAPKGKVLDPKAGKVLHWTNRLLSEGRGLGMTFLLDSQRPQKVHNDTLTSCETLIAMRVTHAADRNALKDWIDGCGDKATGTEVLNTVAGMARGEGWVWSPEIGFGPQRIQFPMFETFDSFAPAQLQNKVSDSGWSTVDLEVVKSKLAKVIEEAKENDPAALKAEVVRLKRVVIEQQTAQGKPDHSEQAILKRIQTAIEERDKDWRFAIDVFKRQLNNRYVEVVETIGKAFKDISFPWPADVLVVSPPSAKVGGIAIRTDPTMSRTQVDIQDRNGRRPAITNIGSSNGHGGESLSGPQRQILQRLAEFTACGRSSVRLSWLAASMGTTVRARGFEENMRSLTKGGFVTKPDGESVRATAEGEAISGRPSPLSGEILRAKITQMLSGSQADILRYLIESQREEAIEHVAARFDTTVRARGFEENIRFLRSNDLIETNGGQVRAADWIL